MGLVVGGLAALTATLLITPQYTASTQLFVSATDSFTTSAAFQGSQFSQQRVASYAALIGGEETADRVIGSLGLNESPTELRNSITVTAVPNTVLIDVAVTDPSPQRAQQIAQAIGVQFPLLVSQLETPAIGSSPVKVTVVDSPEVPSHASSPNLTFNIALGVLVGLLVGVAAALARARLDRSIKTAEDAAELTGAPAIGVVLRNPELEKHHVADGSRMSRVAEDYRQLRANLQFLDVDERPKVIMISSSLPAEGKTTVVVNLARALADAGRKVTIVDADLRRSKVARYLGMVGGVGLTNILAGTAELDEVIQLYNGGELSVIAAGPMPPNPGALLASASMSELLDKLRAGNDYVLLDCPPILPVADSTGLAVLVDGVLLSVRYGVTRKDQLSQAVATLDRVGANTLGVILNIVPPKAEFASSLGHGYDYGSDRAAGH